MECLGGHNRDVENVFPFGQNNELRKMTPDFILEGMHTYLKVGRENIKKVH